jgi:hypothetical protein
MTTAPAMTARQIEFPLAVAVCAWCKPKERRPALGAVSHGICMRHLKKLKLEARGLSAQRARPGGRRSLSEPENAADVLPLSF